MKTDRALGLAAWIATLLVVILPAASWAMSAGIVGYSGKQGAMMTCNVCHSGGAAPTVSFSGPMQMDAGAIATFTFTVVSNSSSQKGAGLDLAASGGTLGIVAGQGEQAAVGEITHTAPKSNTKGSASWQFTWRAPATPGSYNLFGSGNSVDLKGDQTGDKSSSTTYSIDVAAPQVSPTSTPLAASPTPTNAPATATPSATHTAASTATPTETIAPPTPQSTATSTVTATAALPTATAETAATRTPCAADCNGDGAFDTQDVAIILAVMNGCPPCPGGSGIEASCAEVAGSCPAADLDADGCIGAAELTRALERATTGNACP